MKKTHHLVSVQFFCLKYQLPLETYFYQLSHQGSPETYF